MVARLKTICILWIILFGISQINVESINLDQINISGTYFRNNNSDILNVSIIFPETHNSYFVSMIQRNFSYKTPTNYLTFQLNYNLVSNSENFSLTILADSKISYLVTFSKSKIANTDSMKSTFWFFFHLLMGLVLLTIFTILMMIKLKHTKHDNLYDK